VAKLDHMNKETFIETFKKFDFSIHLFTKVKYLINIELGVRPDDPEVEKLAIINAFESYNSISVTLISHLFLNRST